jgi:hypothetical protein
MTVSSLSRRPAWLAWLAGLAVVVAIIGFNVWRFFFRDRHRW